MQLLGVHSHLFRGPAAAAAAACREHGLGCVQLTPGFPGLLFHDPGQITPAHCRLAAEPFREEGVRIACLSGATNLLDPDLQRRHTSIVRLHALIRHCRDFGADRVVIEAGSLSPKSALEPYAGNRSPAAWDELLLIVTAALRVAADHEVLLLLKPQPTHVLATLADALRLRDELAHPLLGFVLDPVNFLLESRPAEWNVHLERLVGQLGPWAPVVHAKDLAVGPEGITRPRVGRGVLDYALFLRLLRRYQPNAPIILEHLRPEEVAEARVYLQGRDP